MTEATEPAPVPEYRNNTTGPLQTGEGAWLAPGDLTDPGFDLNQERNAALVADGSLIEHIDETAPAPPTLDDLSDDELADWFKGKKLEAVIAGNPTPEAADRLLALEQAKSDPREPVIDALGAIAQEKSA
jgi:hypothetical protein